MRECRAVGAPGSCFQKSLLIGVCALHPEHTWILIKFGIYTGPFKDLVVYCFHFQGFRNVLRILQKTHKALSDTMQDIHSYQPYQCFGAGPGQTIY